MKKFKNSIRQLRLFDFVSKKISRQIKIHRSLQLRAFRGNKWTNNKKKKEKKIKKEKRKKKRDTLELKAVYLSSRIDLNYRETYRRLAIDERWISRGEGKHRIAWHSKLYEKAGAEGGKKSERRGGKRADRDRDREHAR